MPPKKRLQWQAALHEGGVTIEGLRRIVSKVSGQRVGRRTLMDANRLVLDSALCTESIVVDGEPFNWDMADPVLLVQEVLGSSTQLQTLYGRAAQRFPCSATAPWSIVIGLDEFTPGSKFKQMNLRKV